MYLCINVVRWKSNVALPAETILFLVFYAKCSTNCGNPFRVYSLRTLWYKIHDLHNWIPGAHPNTNLLPFC